MHKINTPTPYWQDLKERILEVSMQMFKEHGIKAVKMDDISNSLSISKRTLYEIYANKEDLLLEGLKHHNTLCEKEMDALAARPDHTVMDVILNFYHSQMQDFSNVNPIFYSDIHKYPRVMKYLSSKHEERESYAKGLFCRGVEEGYFRSDVDYDLVSKVGNATMNRIMEMKMYRDYSMQHIFRNVIFLLMRGFCTIKGIKIIDELLK